MEIKTFKTRASYDFQTVELEVSLTQEDIANGAVKKLQQKAMKLAFEQAEMAEQIKSAKNTQTQTKKTTYETKKYSSNKYIGGNR